MLQQASLVGIAELKLASDECVSPVEGFTLLHTVVHPTVKSGGLAVFARCEHASQYEVVTSSGADGYVVIKCPGGLHVVFTYFAPDRSPVYERGGSRHPMDVLQYLLDSLRSRGPLLLMGDFNARCGAGDDRVNPAVDELVEQIGVVSELRRAHRAALPPRAGVADQGTNSRGVELITFMQVEDVVLLNGRVAGAGNGGYTYHATKGVPGSSTPDLCLATADMFEQWGSHIVLDVGPQHLHPDFDHLPLMLTLSPVADGCTGPTLAAPRAASTVAGDALWCDEDIGLPPDWYEQVMGAPPSHKPSFRSICLPEYVAYMQTVLPELDALLSNHDPTVVVGTLQQHLQAASQDSMPWVPMCPTGGHRVLSPLERAAQIEWYTADLAQLREQLGQVWRNQGVQSAEYGHLSRVYKSRCRSAKRDAQLQHTQEVYNLIRAAPRKFWQQYFKGRKQGPQRHMPDATSWAAYGQQLYADPHPGARPVL